MAMPDSSAELASKYFTHPPLVIGSVAASH